MVVVGGVAVLFTVTFTQPRSKLPSLEIVKLTLQDDGFGVQILLFLSRKSADSTPVSAAKKASLVSRASVLKFISSNAILATPKDMAKRMLEIVTAKRITNPERRPLASCGTSPPLFLFVFKIIFVILPIK